MASRPAALGRGCQQGPVNIHEAYSPFQNYSLGVGFRNSAKRATLASLPQKVLRLLPGAPSLGPQTSDWSCGFVNKQWATYGCKVNEDHRRVNNLPKVVRARRQTTLAPVRISVL